MPPRRGDSGARTGVSSETPRATIDAVTRQQLRQRLDDAWRDFTVSYAGLSEAELVTSGVTKAWSVRDIIAHVTTWEEEALKHAPEILEGRRPPRYSVTYGGIDAFNALRTKQKAHLSLAEVFRQHREIHQRVITMIEQAPEDEIVRETRFRRRVKLDTYGHYPTHTQAIVRWRAERS